jgi:hypothetical protein
MTTEEVTAAIHSVLGASRKPDNTPRSHQPERDSILDFEDLLPDLLELGAHSVLIEFDGSGDSGAIEYISLYTHDEYTLETTIETPTDLQHSIERAATNYLEQTDVNWYDGDGGFGDITITIEDGSMSVRAEINTRYTESNCALDITHNLTDEGWVND